MYYKKNLLLLIGNLLFIGLFGKSIINGNFEDNAEGCLLNISNNEFNSTLLNVHAFGAAENLDIVHDTCGFGNAVSGNYYVGISTGQIDTSLNEAFSFDLTSPLMAGDEYSISFFCKGLPIGTPNLNIGISATNDSVGQVIGQTPSNVINTDWSQSTINFIAPLDGNYISVFASGNVLNVGVFVDDFNLSHLVGTSNNVIDEKISFAYPNPTRSNLNIRLPQNRRYNSIQIFNIHGSLVFQETIGTMTEWTIDVSGFLDGVYIIVLESENGNTLRNKLIIK